VSTLYVNAHERADFAVWRDPVAGLDGPLTRGDAREIARKQRRQAERFAA